MIVTSELFRLRRVNYGKKMRICMSLEDEHRVATSSSSTIVIPTKIKVLNALEVSVNTNIPNENPLRQWEWNYCQQDVCSGILGVKAAIIGCVKKLFNKNLFKVEHLHRVAKNKYDRWWYPANSDTQQVAPDQIDPSKIKGKLGSSISSSKFVLYNCKAIGKYVKLL